MQIVYENEDTLVEVNSSGEVFVSVKRQDKIINTLRITPQPNYELGLTSTGSHFVPTAFYGLGGFILRPKN